MADSMTIETRIAHFLKLAEDDGATQAERDLASSQAERLMLKHGIDRATAEAKDGNVKVEEKIVRDHIFFGGIYADERMHAAHMIVSALKLQGYLSKNSYGIDEQSSHGVNGRATKGIRYYIVGFESDVREAKQLVLSLDLQAAVGVKNWVKEQKANGGYNWAWASAPEKTLKRKGYITGFGVGAAKRIREAREQVVEESGEGTALVLINREQKVADFYSTLTLGKQRATQRRADYSGYGAGSAAGYSANTGGRSVGAQQRSTR